MRSASEIVMTPYPKPAAHGSTTMPCTPARCPSPTEDRILMSSLLRRSHSPRDSDRLACTLLEAFGTPACILAADGPSLSRVGGLAAEAISDLKLLKHLAERLARTEASRQPLLSSSTALQAYLRVALASEPREQFRVLFLDKRNRLLRDEGVAHGTVDHAPVYPREV